MSSAALVERALASVVAVLTLAACPYPTAIECSSTQEDCPEDSYCDRERGYCVTLAEDGVPPGRDAAPSADASADAGVVVRDAARADSRRLDAEQLDLSEHDALGLDIASPDATVPDAALSDAAQPDAAEQDVPRPDVSQLDVPPPDGLMPDALMPDALMPDALLPDTSLPDTSLPDTSLPDSAQPDAYTPVVYSSSFEDGAIDDFVIGDGRWDVSSGELHQTVLCEENRDIMLDGESWSDMTARVRIRFDATCGIGGSLRQAALLVRVQDVAGCNSNRYYGCLIDVDGDVMWVAEWNNVCVTSDGVNVSAPGLALDSWYDVVARVEGNTLTCELSGPGLTGTVTRSRTDTSTLIDTGSVGFAAWTAQVSFDDLEVELP
jgi:hypothetical protein